MRAYAALLLALSSSSCALTSKGEVLDVRYFAPEVPALRPGVQPRPVATTTPGLSLRVGRISASAHLRKYLVYRPTAVEVRMDSARWWAEAPEDYLRRAVIDAMFVERPVEQSLSGSTPTLDCELLAFEQVTDGKQNKARVAVRFALHDQMRVLSAGTLTVERVLRQDDNPEELARELGTALEEASDQLAARVVERLKEETRPLEEPIVDAPAKR